MKEIAVKNMVCNRCIKVVREELNKNKIEFVKVALGKIYFTHHLDSQNKKNIEKILKKEGFELLEDRESKLINQIKSLILSNIHHQQEKSIEQNFSDFLAASLGVEYSQLSKLFSNTEGRSIENYIIAQKIERAKELLIYDELTLSQISYELNYSSPQHLSRQFKQVTGLTPTIFKKIGKRKKLDTI